MIFIGGNFHLKQRFEVFHCVQDFIGGKGKSVRHFESMELMPNFTDKFQMNGIDLPRSFFMSGRGER